MEKIQNILIKICKFMIKIIRSKRLTFFSYFLSKSNNHFFRSSPPPYPVNFPFFTNDPMTRNNDSNSVGTISSCDGPNGFWMLYTMGLLLVSSGLSIRNLVKGFPDFILENCSRSVKRNFKCFSFTLKILC